MSDRVQKPCHTKHIQFIKLPVSDINHSLNTLLSITFHTYTHQHMRLPACTHTSERACVCVHKHTHTHTHNGSVTSL